MKMNTIEQLNEFKVNDRVAIHSVINGKVSYYAIIKHVHKEAYIKDGIPSRIAMLIDDSDNIRQNFLSSATKVS